MFIEPNLVTYTWAFKATSAERIYKDVPAHAST